MNFYLIQDPNTLNLKIGRTSGEWENRKKNYETHMSSSPQLLKWVENCNISLDTLIYKFPFYNRLPDKQEWCYYNPIIIDLMDLIIQIIKDQKKQTNDVVYDKIQKLKEWIDKFNESEQSENIEESKPIDNSTTIPSNKWSHKKTNPYFDYNTCND